MSATAEALKSAFYGKNITPDDETPAIGFTTREVSIQKDDDLTLVCDITVIWADGSSSEETLTGLPPGRYAWAITGVKATGTTATSILAFR